MSKIYNKILKEYMKEFPNEQVRQEGFRNYLERYNDIDVIDKENYDGHVVINIVIYSKLDKKFLLLKNNDFINSHIDKNIKIEDIIDIKDIKYININENNNIPFDINGILIKDIKEHYHYNFRYLFIVDKIENIKEEYKLVSISEMKEIYNKEINKMLNIFNDIIKE